MSDSISGRPLKISFARSSVVRVSKNESFLMEGGI